MRVQLEKHALSLLSLLDPELPFIWVKATMQIKTCLLSRMSNVMHFTAGSGTYIVAAFDANKILML